MKPDGTATGLTLDTGALLALERGDRRVRALLRRVVEHDIDCVIPAGVVAQSWRGGPRQARIARLLGDAMVQVRPLDDLDARAVGMICGRTGHTDVVDVHVGLIARELSHHVVTSDPDDIRRVDPTLPIITI
ncbi:MAG: PIN domain nuclease [Actinobacteria bacterium]|nr:PIN domain nuclease [Actinomycetota bacterium]